MNRFLLLLAFVLVACAGPSTPPPATDDTQVIIPETTKVADAATRAALSSYDPESGVLTFTQPVAGQGLSVQSLPVLANLKSGDVLASEPTNAAPSGYLRKVTGIRQDGAQTILDTTQANLTDAIAQGELNTDFQLNGDDLLRTEGLPQGATLTVNTVPAGNLKPQAGIGEQYSFTLNFDHTFVPISGPNATGTIRVEGGVAFNVGYGVNVGIKPCFELPPICVHSFQASVGFSQNSHLNIVGDFQGAVGDSVLVGTQYFKPKIFFIGPVPVVLVPKVELYLTAGGEVTAHVEFAASESVTAQIGARWTKGNGWKDISGFGIDGTLTPPKFTGSLKPRVGVQSRASFTLYDVAGPEATLEGGVNLDVAYLRSPNWMVSGFLKGTLGFRVKLPILGTLASYSTTLFDVTKELGRSGNTPPALTLTSQPHTLNINTPQNFRALCTANGPTFGNGEFYNASDAEDGCPQITVVSDKDGTLTPDYTFTVPGDRTVTVTARDSAGATTPLRFTLSVINPPPVLTLDYAGDPHQGAPYSISATITDPGEGSATNFCANTTWAVDAPDTLRQISGCQVEVTFGATGARQVRVSTHDRLGATTSRTVTLNVLPPLVNLYPKIAYAGVYDRDAPRIDVPGCSTTSLVQGETMNLTWPRMVCAGAEAGPTVFYAKAVLENPQNEALTFSWKLIVTPASGDVLLETATQPIFNLTAGYNGNPVTDPCRITLVVGAPDPSRSKSLTVWTGKCVYRPYATVLK
ncbi:hypothetical protein [Deinococcus altitudinis]|uniref:hypothetical protein n=1 Tax=Deinococcus altitudinis TaxID=468914 RepID=UPI0038913BCC